MKKLVALALGTVMTVSMTAGVSAATVESKDDLKNANAWDTPESSLRKN